MSTVIINGIEYVPAKTVTGTRAAAEPVDVRHLDPSFRFDPDAQQHIPTLLVEFEPVSAVGGGDPKAKGWRDRDLLAMMLRGQPTAHIAPAEQPQPDEAWTRRMAAIEAEADDPWPTVGAPPAPAEQPQPEPSEAEVAAAMASLHRDMEPAAWPSEDEVTDALRAAAAARGR